MLMHVNACGCWIIPILCQWITVPANLCLKPFLIGIDAPIRSLEEVLAKPPQFCCHSMSFLPNSDLSRCFDVWIVSASSSSKRPRMSPASGRVPRPCSLCSTYTWHLASEHEGIGEHDIATVSKNTLQQQRSRQLFMSFSPDVICHEIYVICQNLRCGDVQRMCLCFKGFPLASTGVGGGGSSRATTKDLSSMTSQASKWVQFSCQTLWNHGDDNTLKTHSWKQTVYKKRNENVFFVILSRFRPLWWSTFQDGLSRSLHRLGPSACSPCPVDQQAAVQDDIAHGCCVYIYDMYLNDMYVYTNIHKYRCLYVCDMYTYTYTYTYVCMYVCLSVCMYIYIH